MKSNNNKLLKTICFGAVAIALFTYNSTIAAPVATPVKNTPAKTEPAIAYLSVSPINVVDFPEKYLNKNITFDAEFIGFTSLGLDYKPALRDASKYIGILVRRDDVKNHTIPLSEMKIFLSRDEAEKHVDLEAGDKIKISGKVFSTALGDPWVDVKNFSVLTEKKKDKKEN